ncbi:MAG: S-methyl-5'-thioadenosine phosphorylase [Planctomycetota bacterium]
MNDRTLGILGGSGLYDLPGLENREEISLETPFGPPSDKLVTGTLHGVRCAFLPRHGKGHRLAPHELPFRANLAAMKMLGMECVLGISAVGSLAEEIVPGDLVLIDQFIDRTRSRTHESTFFGGGCVAHAHFADPVWEPLRKLALAAARDASGARVHDGGTYVCMEGPHFSTRAESHLYRSWGAKVIGMTNLQEAKLAREAEIAYATVALATDYDCWREGDAVDVAAVVAVLLANVEKAKRVIVEVAKRLAALPERMHCKGVMEHSVMTAKSAITADARRRLEQIARDLLG